MKDAGSLTISSSERTRPLGAVVFEIASIAAAIVLWIVLAKRFAAGPSLGPAAIVLALVCGIIGADLTSGFLHWLCDTFFAETTPIIGQQLVAPFREHHRDPLAMTQHGFIELNGNSCTTLLGLMTPLWWLGPVTPRSAIGVFGYLAFLAYCVALSVTNSMHSWAHDPEPPLLARVLWALGLAVSPEHHAEHHVRPHRKRFCVTTGWANYFVDFLSVPHYNERLFVALGLPRKSDDDEPGPEQL